jgi:hypothetical protein
LQLLDGRGLLASRAQPNCQLSSKIGIGSAFLEAASNCCDGGVLVPTVI